MSGFSRRDCFKLALVWGFAAALLSPILLRDALPMALVFVAAVLFYVAVFWLAYKFCGRAPAQAAAPAETAAGAAPRGPSGLQAAAMAPAAAAAPEPAAEPALKPSPVVVAPALAAIGDGDKPKMLTAAREGGADDLKKIKGVGPKLEALLNRLGVFHFDQIAAWTLREVAWVDENLEGFKGRVTRDEWVAQSKILASGGQTAFAARVEAGDVPSSQG